MEKRCDNCLHYLTCETSRINSYMLQGVVCVNYNGRNPFTSSLAIERKLDVSTLIKKGTVNGCDYAVHSSGNEIIITDINDFKKILSIQTKGFYEVTKGR